MIATLRPGDEVALVCAHLRTVTHTDPLHDVTRLWCDPCDRMRDVRGLAAPRTARELAQRLAARLERTESHAPDAVLLSAGERSIVRQALDCLLATPGALPVTPHAEHAEAGPRDCDRCQMLRDNADWMARP